MSKAFHVLNILRSASFQPRPLLLCKRTCATFKSSIHTDNLYPGSDATSKYAKFDLAKLPTKDQTFTGFIPMNEIEFTYSHSSGPGGQNVNKNLTKVDLRFHLESASWLTDDVKNILKMMHVNQITKEGYLIVKSDRTRSRQLNQADALQKLRQFIWASVDEVRTYLERSQVTQVEQEKLLKAEQRAARERVKSKRIYSQQKQARKPSDF